MHVHNFQGQGRLDGAFCEYTETEKLEYLKHLQCQGIINIEMESTVIAALTHQAGIKTAIVCVTLLDRLVGDQVSFFSVYKTIYVHTSQ